MEEHPGVTAVRQKTAKPKNSDTTRKPTRNPTTGGKTMTDNDPTAAAMAEAMREAKAAYAATVKENLATEAELSSLNARLDQGDATVTLDEIERAELSIRRLSRLAEGQARIAREAEIAYQWAAADLRLAGNLAAALNAQPATEPGIHGHLFTYGLEQFVAVQFDAIAKRRPSDNEGRTYYISQDAPTKRNTRTGVESGWVLLAVPSNVHVPNYADRWIGGARKADILIGERSGNYGTRSLVGMSGKQKFLTLADGCDYAIHRVLVESATPSIPVITETDLVADGESWVRYFVEQIEHKAAVELSYGSSFQVVRDVRLAVRGISTTEDVDRNRVVRSVVANGQVSINPNDDFADLDRFIVAPLVDQWLNDTLPVGSSIAPGLGRATAVDVQVRPVSRAIADVTITGSFVSTTA